MLCSQWLLSHACTGAFRASRQSPRPDFYSAILSAFGAFTLHAQRSISSFSVGFLGLAEFPSQLLPESTSCTGIPPFPSRSNHCFSQSEERISENSSVTEPPNRRRSRFVDRLVIVVRGGKGGDGAIAYVPGRGKKQRAAGGRGAAGGNVIIRSTQHAPRIDSLPRHAYAGAGGPGGRARSAGARGKDIILKVPLGTMVKKVCDILPWEAGTPGDELEQEGHASDEQSSKGPAKGSLKGCAESPGFDKVNSAASRRGRCRYAWLDRGDFARLDRWKAVALDRSRTAGMSGKAQVGIKAQGWPDGPDVGEMLGPDGLPLWSSQPGVPTSGLLDDDAGCKSEEDQETEAWSGGRQRSRISEEDIQRAEVLADLIHEGQEVVVAYGGDGGLGNYSFPSKPHGPASDQCEEGHPGTATRLLLESKLIADVGFVGMPNAGKSTLLAALSAAKAKVGSYAFTTLQPQLGTLLYGPRRQRLTLADIPGLIQGAHANRGRGNKFLRHIERTRCLAFVLDLSGGAEGSLVPLPPNEQLQVLRRELKFYNEELLQVPSVIVANKVDAVSDVVRTVRTLQQFTQLPIVPVSANRQFGLEELVESFALLLPTSA